MNEIKVEAKYAVDYSSQGLDCSISIYAGRRSMLESNAQKEVRFLLSAFARNIFQMYFASAAFTIKSKFKEFHPPLPNIDGPWTFTFSTQSQTPNENQKISPLFRLIERHSRARTC